FLSRTTWAAPSQIRNRIVRPCWLGTVKTHRPLSVRGPPTFSRAPYPCGGALDQTWPYPFQGARTLCTQQTKYTRRALKIQCYPVSRANLPVLGLPPSITFNLGLCGGP